MNLEKNILEKNKDIKTQIIRSIQTLKARRDLVNISAIARETGIPQSYIYKDIELLKTIFGHCDHLSDADKLILELNHEKIKIYDELQIAFRDLKSIRDSEQRIYAKGFADGCAIKMQANLQDQSQIAETKMWAYGILHLDPQLNYIKEDIKKAYRKMVSLLHPDQNQKDSSEEFSNLQKAYEILSR